MALNFVINYEEGGEKCMLHGDDGSEHLLSEIVGAAPYRESVSIYVCAVNESNKCGHVAMDKWPCSRQSCVSARHCLLLLAPPMSLTY